MQYKNELLAKMQNGTAKIGVIGMGYVGLPLAVEFAEKGFQVIAIDVDDRKVEQLNNGISYIEDIPTDRLAKIVSNGSLIASSKYEDLQVADTISICVPTPLRKTRDPDMSYIISAINELSKTIHPGVLIVLESTTYPGTTREVIQPRLESTGLEVGKDVFIAFSPERIDPGNKTYTVHNTPKVVGGTTPSCTELAQALYGTVAGSVVPVSSPSTAEMVKLLENTFRAVNIGLANEIALMCDKLDINVWEVIEAASTKPFGFMPFYPGPGLGGHCIPVDPHYLSWKLKTLNYTAKFIELASEVNTSMPYYVVDKVTEALNNHSKSVRGSTIIVLGVAYKPNVNDVRESPALDIIELLRQKGSDVVYHDPYVPSIKLNEDGYILENCEYSPELIQSADCVVIVTNHDEIDWDDVLDNCQTIVDTRNVYSNQTRKSNGKIISI